jgi:hypothetical protein
MFLVVIHWFNNGVNDTPCVVSETREKAEEWIDKQMEGKEYSGMGVYQIKEIELI